MLSNNIKIRSTITVVLIIALSLFSYVIVDSNEVLTKKHNYNHKSQKIGLAQTTNQNLECGLPGTTGGFCSNQSSQNQKNSGNNMAEQIGGQPYSNSIKQGIELDQTTNQNLECGLPGTTGGFCSNQSSQNQIDTGDNTIN